MSEQKGWIQVGDQTLEAVVCLEPTCIHPQLSLIIDMPGNNHIYQCTVCKKKVIISLFQASLNVLSHQEAQENFGGMIELAFGPTWGKLAREGKL